MSEEQRLKTLAELSNAETIPEMKTSLIQLTESITDLIRRLFLFEFGITKEGKFSLKMNTFIPKTERMKSGIFEIQELVIQ